MNTNLFVNTNVPFCSRWACGSRNLIKLGNELLLSCPRPPPDGQALSTKTLDVMSRKSRKKISSQPPTFVTFWCERHKTPSQTPLRPLFWGLVTPGRNHGRESVEVVAQVEFRAAGGRASGPLQSAAARKYGT